MWIEFSAFKLQKAGNKLEEYEDAYAPLVAAEGEYGEFLCAVADGATETSFSGQWAKLLVDAFADRRLPRLDMNAMAELSRAWQAQIDDLTREKPLSWYAEEKLRSGAFASLMGLQISPHGWWRAFCVGDSCLFRLRTPRRIRKAFPYTDAAQFNNRPILLSTNPASNGKITPVIAKGKWREGDRFLLMTDAIAQYFLAHRPSRLSLTEHLLDQEKFERIIDTARQNKACRNDDVTMLRIYLKPGANSGDVA
jgi:serine/threonine protein phosphatase PrpC